MPRCDSKDRILLWCSDHRRSDGIDPDQINISVARTTCDDVSLVRGLLHGVPLIASVPAEASLPLHGPQGIRLDQVDPTKARPEGVCGPCDDVSPVRGLLHGASRIII